MSVAQKCIVRETIDTEKYEFRKTKGRKIYASEFMFQMWKDRVIKEDRKPEEGTQPKCIAIANVQRSDTMEIIEHALEKTGHTILEIGSFKPGTEGTIEHTIFLALLGTLNGKTIGHMLIDHYTYSGKKKIRGD
ncbi:hypothetical protein AJ80_08565 [Polytolypa hystricis UAMH7299]|uniref:Uncharacterized protein n=1 Tax=Polytolypa hystricis (strain UAMH7299) TaxID=1447883 RepID=A0A2B7X5P0_POLH7|nr:hypothetical protein AJ80_08565 [Polytolypa hystricis UAMH7299]